LSLVVLLLVCQDLAGGSPPLISKIAGGSVRRWAGQRIDDEQCGATPEPDDDLAGAVATMIGRDGRPVDLYVLTCAAGR
jgi:hypothetical protein